MRIIKKISLVIAFLAFVLSNTELKAQLDPGAVISKQREEGIRIVPTGVPFLYITPDSRAGAMGDVGVASEPDANSQHWNASKYAFSNSNYGLSLTYNPWLRNTVSDISLSYLSGFYKINPQSAIAGSLTYFSLGSIDFFGQDGDGRGSFKPNELAIDLSYSMKLTDNLSASVTGRYIRSDLTQGQSVNGMATYAGNAGAADVGLYYKNKLALTGYDQPAEYAFGLQLSNLGSKVSYSDDMKKDFLPANMKLGGRFTMDFDRYNRFSVMLDINKLLVPTPQLDTAGNLVIVSDVNTLQGAIQSFYDAPNGIKEELQELMLSVGLEYVYNKFLFVRAGYFYENPKKGNRQYITFGGGLKYNVMKIDVAYLVPTAEPNNPLKNTLRLSLSLDI